LKKKHIKDNPAANIAHPKFRIKKQRFLTKQEYLALKEQSRENPKIYAIIELLLQSGIRISELSRLKVKDVVVLKTNSYIKIEASSNNEERKVPLNQKALSMLKSHLTFYKLTTKVNYPVFATKTGKPIEVRNIRSSIDKMLLKAKIKNACVNDLRNTFIVYQLSSGFPIAKLGEIVGHKNLSTTSRYLDLLTKKYKAKPVDKIFDL
jgi:site-specific recombinase XerD